MICETCQKRFRDIYALRRHRQPHEGTSTMELCTKCNGVFKHLKNHFINCKAPKTKNFKCGICNVSFLREKNLSMHIKRKHTSPKLYPCGCGKCFLYPFSVKRHSKNVQTSGVDDLEIMRYLPGATFYHIKQILLFHRLPFR